MDLCDQLRQDLGTAFPPGHLDRESGVAADAGLQLVVAGLKQRMAELTAREGH
jgi:hypothetical protein